MVGFKATSWQLSELKEEEKIPVIYGLRTMFIQHASYDEQGGIYKLSVMDLENRATFTLTYWLYSVDKITNERTVNNKTRGTLTSLGKALAGYDIGVPFPGDVIGGVVGGDVVQSTSAKGTEYQRVYAFLPVEKYYADCGTIDQYYIGAEIDLPEEEPQE